MVCRHAKINIDKKKMSLKEFKGVLECVYHLD